MANTAIVLLSGGLDSSTCLAIAVRDFGANNVSALSVDYGQRHIKELRAAKAICGKFGVDHEVVEIKDMPKSMLTNAKQEVPNISYDEIQGVSPTYVPFRNGLLLSRIASRAQAGNFNAIYFGAHSEDAANWAYPDCTPEFIGAMANAIYIGTYHQVRLMTPLQWLMKDEIVKLGHFLSVPLDLTWSCYKGENLHCGVCPTCRSRKEAFKKAYVADPTVYAA